MEDRDVRPNGSPDIEAELAPSRLRSVERQLVVGDLRRLISGTEAPWISDARVEELTGVEIDEFTTRLEVTEAAEVRLRGIEPRYVLVISDPSVDALALAVDLDPAVIARLACEEFAGELNGPGSFADAEADLVIHGSAGIRYSIPELRVYGVSFSTELPPRLEDLAEALGVCAADVEALLSPVVGPWPSANRR